MASVVLHSHDTNNTPLTITLTQTGPANAHIRKASAGHVDMDQNVKNVRADPAALRLTCEIDAFLLWGDIDVAVQRGAGGQPPKATIKLSHIVVGSGTYDFELASGDDDAVEAFLQQAAFPPLAAAVV